MMKSMKIDESIIYMIQDHKKKLQMGYSKGQRHELVGNYGYKGES